MFSLILSILIIDNKVNDNVITIDFFNFAVFCLVYDMLILLYNFVLMSRNGFHIHVTSSFIIYLLALVEAALILKSGPGNKVSDESYALAIIFLVVESISLMVKNKHRLFKREAVGVKQFDKFEDITHMGKITHPKNRKMTARYI